MDRFAAALVNLANALEEWKNAGTDVLSVVGAIQEFIDAKAVMPPVEPIQLICASCQEPWSPLHRCENTDHDGQKQ